VLNITCREALQLIYSSFCESGYKRVIRFESDQKIEFKALSEDDKRNEPYHFQVLFSGTCIDYLQGLNAKYGLALAQLSFEQSQDVIECLELLQSIIASAYDRFRFEMPDELINFIRRYERLDVAEVRKMLHEECKSRYSKS
jgi:hypothetical protein